MKKLAVAALIFLGSIAAASAQTPWPGQCPAGVASTSVGCQPQAGALAPTDLMLGWQIGSQPHTVAMQVQQLLTGGLPGSFSTITASGNTTLNGTLTVAGLSNLAGVTATSIADSGNATVGGTLGVTGNTTMNGNLGVTGNETIGGTLSVTGAASIPLLSAPPVIFGTFYGMKCDGATNDTTAFQNAVAAAISGGILYMPVGTCLMNASISGNFIDIIGAGRSTVVQPFAAGSPAITVTGSNFAKLRDFAITSGGFPAGSGIVLASTANNTELRGLYISGFQTYNIDCEGTSGTISTGNSMYSSVSLAPVTSTANVRWNYCNDFRLVDNTIGSTTGGSSGGPGIQLNNSVGGQIRGNLISFQNIGINATSSSFDSILGNRISSSFLEGILGTTLSNFIINDNLLYTNSTGATGAVGDADFTGLINSTIIGNTFGSSSGSTTNYSVSLDATSGTITMMGNLFSYYTVAPTNISATALPSVVLDDNNPVFTASANYKPGNAFSGSSQSSVGGSGSTMYLGVNGSWNTASGTAFPIAFKQTVPCVSVQTMVAPGTGNSYVYTVYKNGSSTGLTMTQSNAATSASVCSIANQFVTSPGDGLAIQVVASASAPANLFFYTIGTGP